MTMANSKMANSMKHDKEMNKARKINNNWLLAQSVPKATTL
jgi:hypothetical protein